MIAVFKNNYLIHKKNFPVSNQTAKAGLASMDLASTHQKLEAFIKCAQDRYYEMKNYKYES